MQIEANGIVVWFDTDDAPVSAPPKGPALVSVGVRPPDPSNAVEVIYRVNGAAEARAAARWRRTETLDGVQYFTAELPVRGGDRVEFSVVCRCAGRQAPRRGQPGAFASFTVGGSRDSAEEASEELPRPAQPDGAAAALAEPHTVTVFTDETAASARREPREVHGQLLDERSDGARGGLRVQAWADGGGPRPVESETDDQGRFRLTLEPTGAEEPVRVLVRVIDVAGVELLQSEATLGPGREPLSLRVSAPAAEPELSYPVDPAVADLGFEHPLDIAATPRAAFAEAVAEEMGAEQANAMHAAAEAQSALVSAVLTDLRVSGDGAAPEAVRAAVAAAPAPCRCTRCQEATGAFAYLADLLAYAVRNLRHDGAAVDVSFLASRLHQPLDRLPVACAWLDKRVPQPRICIEVLRSELGTDAEFEGYLRGAYAMLLEQHGIPFQALRAARAERYRERAELAAAIGIDLTAPSEPPDPSFRDELDQLLLDPAAGTLDESTLETLLGLRNTNRDPLEPDWIPSIVDWRRQRLRRLWREADNRADAPGRPVLDPDLVVVADLLEPTSGRPVFDLLMKRRDELDKLAADIVAKLRASGYDAVLGSWPEGFAANPREPSTFTGRDLLDLRDQLQRGVDIASQLQRLRLELQAFEFLASVAEVVAKGSPVLPSEWQQVADILVQRFKHSPYGLYVTWSSEEDALLVPALREPETGVFRESRYGVFVSPDIFRVPRATLASDEARWSPRRWRATTEARRRWQGTLRARDEQDRAVIAGAQAAVAATEQAMLVYLRQWLLLALSIPGVSGTERPDWFTHRFGVDARSDGCQMTTRVHQAIETLQGILFGARQGGLADPALTLERPAAQFDREWQWLGSYAAWRAAMLVFLYPEQALRPTLRRRWTPGFDGVKTRLQSAASASRDLVDQAASDYERYFQDVCSLQPAGFRASAPRPAAVGSGATRRAIGIARAGANGRLYASIFEQPVQPSQFGGPPNYLAVSEQTLWEELSGVPAGADIAGVLAYHPVGAGPRVGLYAQQPVPGAAGHVFFVSFDTAGGGVASATELQLSAVPALVCSAVYGAGLVRGAQAGAGEWRVGPSDRIVPVDLDGDDATELVVLSGSLEPDGRRRVGVLRERDGALVLSAAATIDGAWTLPTSTTILRVALARWPWSAERLLLIDPNAGRLATLGLAPDGQPRIAALAGPGAIGAWPIDAAARFVAADIDGNGRDELLAVQYRAEEGPAAETGRAARVTMTRTRITVLGVDDGAFGFLAQHDVQLAGVAVSDRWEVLLALRHLGRDRLLVRARHTYYYPYSGRPDRTELWVAELSWQDVFSAPAVSLHAVRVAGWEWDNTDQFLRVRRGPNASDAVFLRSFTSFRVGILVRAPSGMLEVGWQAADRIEPSPGGSAPAWERDWADGFVACDVDGDSAGEVVAISAAGRIAILDVIGGMRGVRWSAMRRVGSPDDRAGDEWRLAHPTSILVADFDGDGIDELICRAPDGRLGIIRAVPPPSAAPPAGFPFQLAPTGVGALTIVPRTSAALLDSRRQQMAAAYASAEPQNLIYLDEAYFHVPIELGLRLAEAGDSTAALDWLRSVYDYERPPAGRKIAPLLERDATHPASFDRAAEWLLDPLDPHAIAELRAGSYTRFTILSIVRCLLDEADAEFTRATSESVPRARALYLAARGLLDAPELRGAADGCRELIGTLPVSVGDAAWEPVWLEALEALHRVPEPATLADAVEEIHAILNSDQPVAARMSEIQRVVGRTGAAEGAAPTLEAVLRSARTVTQDVATAVLGDSRLGAEATGLAPRAVRSSSRRPPLDGFVPTPPLAFCVAPNPVIAAARGRAEANLEKIRSCRNIAGLELRLDPIPGPPSADLAGAAPFGMALPATPDRALRPLPYRYPTLIERAKQITDLARQLETSMLEAILRRDDARYGELLAQHGLGMARAGVRLRELQVQEADGGVRLAELQRDTAGMHVAHYADLLAGGWTGSEKLAVGALATAAALQQLSAHHILGSGATPAHWLEFGTGAVGGFLAGQAQVASFTSQILSAHANFERRQADWRYGQQLAEQDVKIGQQQVTLAREHLDIARQELVIADLEVSNAQTVLDFLTTKRFGTAELFEWVSGVLQGIYRFFLREATVTARLAELQLAFERQELSHSFIQADYWQPPATGGAPRADAAPQEGEDRRGVTGSARLLRDIYELDQHAFRTRQRKLQLTTTFSLERLDPVAFQRFRQTGVLLFSTPMELFDRDFPGHLLRLISRVRTSLIALIPPTHGLRATLSTTGPSRVVIASDTFDTVTVQRGPERVALSSPLNATGLFELNPDPEMLVPFENLGVDTTWRLDLPKPANPFDYSTIADVLVTIDYTALDNPLYRERLLKTLDRRVSGDRPFSFRNELVDQWYDLHNPLDSAAPLRIAFETGLADFPPNIDDIQIAHLLLYLAPAGNTAPLAGLKVTLEFEPTGGSRRGGAAYSNGNGVITTRLGQAGDWGTITADQPPPAGRWTLAFEDTPTTRTLFDADHIEDLIFVITYAGEAPAPPP
jgi:hypothetical protein